MSALRDRERTPVTVAFAAFVLVGVNAGATGILLPAQISDYSVSKTAIGATFFTGSVGFVLASLLAGPMVHRLGMRVALVAGANADGGGWVLHCYPAAVRRVSSWWPSSPALGRGVAESGFQAYIVALPNSTALTNRLHAFFGVGALLGPLLATWILGFASWRTVWFVLAAAEVPFVVAIWATYPRHEVFAPEPPAAHEQRTRGLLHSALRERTVLLGAALLAVYVGLEISVGNWGFSYLVQTRGEHRVLAGYVVSGYWLGLTLGRFLISPFATRIGASAANMAFGCLIGVTVVAALTWVLPGGASIPGFVLLGFFLGPIFPTAMAMVPNVTPARLVPTAIGVMNAGSVIGGSALPWLAGALGQGTGTLPPFALVLALATTAVWWLFVTPRGQRTGYPAVA